MRLLYLSSIRKRQFYSSEYAKSELGYEPKVDLREGIERMVMWFKEYYNKK